MKIVSSLALVVAVGMICGCSTVPDSQVTNVPLNATSINAGNIARPIMMPDGHATVFWFAVSGEPQGSALPGRLQAYIYQGSCGSLSAKPAYDMNDGPNARFYSQASMQYFWKSAPVNVETLRAGGYALVVKESPADGHQAIFCGNLS
ncbi:hypothetical protein IMF27_22655 [Pseudomonas sp. PCH199]|uniref:hypothetical protein n=1 Tax=unclassified Pseudomonas TaxID=196821 RepID=UPI000BD15123|nr:MULTISPECIES: hypothetical protein [unclassified Pseudomonas]MCW8278022.1 hypothetical protein [Pseudomonas sp. PCH199]PAM81717.1 hypothetical protein CES87_23130 [Pseudomonas sp. ERMR1:02]